MPQARQASFDSLSRELRCTLDDEGRFRHLEGGWYSALGWQPTELHGWHWEEVVHPADRGRAAKAMTRLRATGGCERDLEIRMAVPAGGHRLLTWTMVAGSGPDAIIGIGQDRSDPPTHLGSFTRVERDNEELAARVEELEDRCAAVERFAGTAAHQLAEPLVIAESSAILVAEELGPDLDPLLRGRLDAIGRGAARARRLMDALLADARTSGTPPELRPVDLGSVVNGMLASLDQQIEERSASIVVRDLPRVHGDPGLLSVVLENLASNALKYGPRTGGRVEISAQRRDEGWRVSVAGEGRPIAQEEAERIFQPFYRVPAERRVPGVGLGLAICARLMERLGGTIGVEPGAGSGNTFWIELRPAAA